MLRITTERRRRNFNQYTHLKVLTEKGCDTQRIKIRSVLGESKRKRKRKEGRRKQSFNFTTCLRCVVVCAGLSNKGLGNKTYGQTKPNIIPLVTHPRLPQIIFLGGLEIVITSIFSYCHRSLKLSHFLLGIIQNYVTDKPRRSYSIILPQKSKDPVCRYDIVFILEAGLVYVKI